MVFKARDFTFFDDKTHVMGILNITPDSFSDGGSYQSTADAVKKARLMAELGADIIDIGGQSTRPGSTVISADEELARIEPVLSALKNNKDFALSVDTFYPEVAQRALELGADIINDVSGSVSAKMAKLAADYGCGWVIMHNNALVSQNTVDEIHSWFKSAAKKAQSYGVSNEQICFDAGIGFNKSNEQCYDIIKNTSKVKLTQSFYLLGASRKRCIGTPLGDIPANMRDTGTVAAHTIGILGGANIIRAHDVLKAVQSAKVADAIIKG